MPDLLSVCEAGAGAAEDNILANDLAWPPIATLCPKGSPAGRLADADADAGAGAAAAAGVGTTTTCADDGAKEWLIAPDAASMLDDSTLLLLLL